MSGIMIPNTINRICKRTAATLDISFTARVQAIGRLAIPKEIREQLSIREGDLVTVNIQKIIARKPRPPQAKDE